jgi:DNA-directed RNA polymerase subunit RPC12/RpoP
MTEYKNETCCPNCGSNSWVYNFIVIDTKMKGIIVYPYAKCSDCGKTVGEYE